MRNKLAELILNAPPLEFPFGSRRQGKRYQTATHLADHLLANGVIVPPCKEGDTLWFIKWYDEGKLHKPISRKVIYFSFKDNDVVVHFKDGACDSHCIGECAFLTKEQAEKALAERSGK